MRLPAARNRVAAPFGRRKVDTRGDVEPVMSSFALYTRKSRQSPDSGVASVEFPALYAQKSTAAGFRSRKCRVSGSIRVKVGSPLDPESQVSSFRFIRLKGGTRRIAKRACRVGGRFLPTQFA
jgi:hypothetical protein